VDKCFRCNGTFIEGSCINCGNEVRLGAALPINSNKKTPSNLGVHNRDDEEWYIKQLMMEDI